MQNRVYVFIDAANLWQAQKAKGKVFDYRKLKNFIEKKFNCYSTKFFYYTAYPKNKTREYSLDSRHKFYTFLKRKLGFIVRKKELKQIRISTKQGGYIKEKGNLDVELTIDAIHYLKEYDTAILFTGDSDFSALVRYIQRNGREVYVFSSRDNISRELLICSDDYFDISKIKEDIWRRRLIDHKNK